MAKKLPPHVTKLDNGKYRVRYKVTQKFPVEYDKTFETEKEALEANNDYLAKITLNIYNKRTKKDMGFSNFCDYVLDWYRNKQKKPSQNTIKHYRQYMDRLRPAFKNTNLRDISAYSIENFLIHEKTRQKMGYGAKVGETITDNTLHHEYVTLRMIMNKAQKWGFIEVNPMAEVEAPEFKEKKIVVPEYDELEEIESKMMKAPIRERCQFLFGLYTGMREEEVCGLHLDDIDEENKCVYVKRAIVQNDTTKEYEETKTKSQSSVRTIPLPDKFFDVYHLYLKYREKYIDTLKKWTHNNYKEIPNLFLNRDGHFYRPCRLGRLWNRFAKENNIYLNFHGLRHYYITNQMNYNDDLSPRDVQELAGHANIKTTYKYVHASQERINNNANNIFNKFTKKELYKNGNDVLTIPITHIMTIMLGDPKFSKTEDLQITLTELSKIDVNLFNISNVMENCKTYLQTNYPSLNQLEKYKYMNLSEKEMMDSIKHQFGKEFQISANAELNLEI